MLNQEDTVIMGDFNGHHKLWHSKLDTDKRGTELANEISDSELIVINEDTPTRVTRKQSSPDITLVSPTLAMRSIWKTDQQAITRTLNNIKLRHSIATFKQEDLHEF